jgi:hypothetical protein
VRPDATMQSKGAEARGRAGHEWNRTRRGRVATRARRRIRAGQAVWPPFRAAQVENPNGV